MNVAYLQRKYEEAINAIDEAINEAEEAGDFWKVVKDPLKEALEADETDWLFGSLGSGSGASSQAFSSWGEKFLYS